MVTESSLSELDARKSSVCLRRNSMLFWKLEPQLMIQQRFHEIKLSVS